MTQVVRFDTSALNRALVGFDQLFNDFEHRFANQITNNYPPHNIIKVDDDHYEIQFAVAGFRMEEIDITVESNVLTIRGTKIEEEDNRVYLHRGLAARNFEREVLLGQYMEVSKAEIKDGLLLISCVRNVPEAMKPRKIKIETM